jgi:hypothetical protein
MRSRQSSYGRHPWFFSNDSNQPTVSGCAGICVQFSIGAIPDHPVQTKAAPSRARRQGGRGLADRGRKHQVPRIRTSSVRIVQSRRRPALTRAARARTTAGRPCRHGLPRPRPAHHTYPPAPAPTIHKPRRPIRYSSLRAISLRHLCRVRLDLMPAILAPHDEPQVGGGAAERRGRAGVRFHPRLLHRPLDSGS